MKTDMPVQMVRMLASHIIYPSHARGAHEHWRINDTVGKASLDV